MKKIKIILTAVLLAACAGYSQEIIFRTFETNTVGKFSSGPDGAVVRPTTQNTNNYVVIVDTNSNPMGTGNAVQMVDMATTNSAQLYYNFATASNTCLSAARVDWSFCPLNASGYTNNDVLNMAVMTYGGSGTLGASSASRYGEMRFYAGVTGDSMPATIRCLSNGQIISNGTEAVGFTNAMFTVVTGQTYRLSMVLNDATNSLTYTYVQGSATNSFTLPGDSIDYWKDEVRIWTGAVLQAVSLSSTNFWTNGLGRVGFNAGTTSSNINVLVDNIKVTQLSGVYIPPPTENPWPAGAWMYEDFEYPNVTNSTPIAHGVIATPSTSTNNNFVKVIGSSANTAGEGQAAELFTDNGGSGGIEYNFATNGATTVRASLSFSWPGVTTNLDSEYMYVAFGAYNTSRTLGTGANRWNDARLCADGTVDFRSSNGTNNNNVLAAGAANTLTLFANDHDSASASYTINGTPYSLPANSIAYWLNGSMVLMSGAEYAPLSSTVSSTTNNFGKFGLAWGSATLGLDYVVDSILVSDIPASSLYALNVTSGGGSGFYTNGQQVAVMANKTNTFVGWIGDTQYLANASSSLRTNTVTMPSGVVNLTATYDRSTLTVNNGTGGGSYTNGEVVTITAAVPMPGISFDYWSGDTQYVASTNSASTTITMKGYDAVVTAVFKTNAPPAESGWLVQRFDYLEAAGDNPSYNSAMVAPSTAAADQFVTVTSSSLNTAGSGQGVELYDNSATNSTGLEYSFMTNGATTVKASFAFTWKNDITSDDANFISVALGAFSNGTGRLFGSSANRYTDARLCADGTVDFRSTSATNNSLPLVAGAANTLTLFANDHDTDAVNYNVNGTIYSLPANSVAYWLNGSLVLMSGAEYAPLDVDKLNPVTGLTVGTTTNNLGRFGFNTTSGSIGTDYVVDDIVVSGIPGPMNALNVNGGSGGGLYTNGAQVVVVANKIPSKTFIGWIGDTQYLASASSSSNTVTMQTAVVNLTAVYDSATLTLVTGSGAESYTNGGPRVSATYTNGQVVEIVAPAPADGKVFKSWTGDVSTVASVTSTPTTLTMPGYDITITSTYKTATYYLTVNSGSGDGSYTNGEVAAITANVYTGRVFVAWTGDVATVTDVNSATTEITMGTNDLVVTATFANAPGWYDVFVGSGSGDGLYTNGTAVEIVANAPPATNQVFNVWTGDVSFVASVSSATTTVTLAGQDVSVYATYKNDEQYTTNNPAGVPYSWLASYFTTNDYEACSLADQDGDGMKTGAEYIAGTIPTNAASVLKAAQTTRNVVTWTPVTGRVYSVYWSTNLVKGFTNKQDNILYPTNNYTNATPDSRVNHYQIKVRMQ